MLRLSGALLSVALFSACAQTGDVQELTPLSPGVLAFHTVGVVVTNDAPEDMDLAASAEAFHKAFVDGFIRARIFANVVDDPALADLVFHCTITHLEDGTHVPPGPWQRHEASITVTVDIADKEKRPFGQLVVTGNSLGMHMNRKGRVWVPADGVRWAMEAATDQIVEYMQSKH